MCPLREGKVHGGSNSTAIVAITTSVDEQSAVLALRDRLPQSYQLSLQSGLT